MGTKYEFLGNMGCCFYGYFPGVKIGVCTQSYI
jgi:hypothetical protein